jgi:dolichol kinase
VIIGAVDLLTQGDILGLLGVYGYVACILVLSHTLRHKLHNLRKLVHILTGGIVFFWWSFDTQWVMAGLAALPFIPILLLTTPISPIKRLRESSLGDISSGGHAYGLVCYAISWTIIAFFLFNDLFVASIAIAAMSFGDGMGELIGKRYGKREFVPNRTVEGSLAVLCATFVAIIIIGWFYFGVIGYTGGTQPFSMPVFALGIAAFVTMIEAVTPGKVDNLVIPLVVGAVLHIMGV